MIQRILAIFGAGLFSISCSAFAFSRPIIPAAPDRLRLVAVGDVQHDYAGGLREWFERLGRDKYTPTRHIIQAADLAFANLESPYTERAPVVQKQFAFATHPQEFDHLLWAGFNLFSLANNHAHDAGVGGITDTLDLMERKRAAGAPIVWAGTGRTPEEATLPRVFVANGRRSDGSAAQFRTAFFAFGNVNHPLMNTFELERAVAEIAELRATQPDIELIIVSVHHGVEYTHVPGDYFQYAYRALIDAGATIVLGHHPHVIQSIEKRGHGLIFYSLGNFSFGSITSRHLQAGAKLHGIIAQIVFERRPEGVVPAELVLYPLNLDNRYPLRVDGQVLEPEPFVPRVVEQPFAGEILRNVMGWCAALGGNELRLVMEGNVARARW